MGDLKKLASDAANLKSALLYKNNIDVLLYLAK